MCEYFRKPKSLGERVKAELDNSNHATKKTEYYGLIKKVNTIHATDTSGIVLRTDYNTKINKIEKKITDHHHDKCITIK